MGSGGKMYRLSLALALALLVAPAMAQADCRPDAVDIRLPSGNSVHFSVELADTPETRAKGLMFREEMPRSAGMLFRYDAPQRATFWMKNTLIPLDMVFADGAGVVTVVHSNAVPQDESVIDGGAGVVFVLEINGGLAKPLGIVAGSVLRHPLIAEDRAAWPCKAK